MMSINDPRRYPGRPGRFERRPPYYQYPYNRPYPYPPYAQPYPYWQPYPYVQPYPYAQPYPNGQPYPETQPLPQEPLAGSCPEGALPYSVQEGDTLDNIASRLGVTPEAIAAVNPNLNLSVPLRTGQTICLPEGEAQES